MFKQIRRMMSLAMLMPSFLLAAPDYKQKFTQILDFISNDFIKSYRWSNHCWDLHLRL
nr:hypothetical protein [Helicobacter pylori]